MKLLTTVMLTFSETHAMASSSAAFASRSDLQALIEISWLPRTMTPKATKPGWLLKMGRMPVLALPMAAPYVGVRLNSILR